jgi:hypothetical protein
MKPEPQVFFLGLRKTVDMHMFSIFAADFAAAFVHGGGISE